MPSLTPRTQGILWELNAAVAFVFLTSLVKFISTEIPTPIIALSRTCLALLFVTPLALVKGLAKPKKASLPWYLVRTVMATATVNAIFYAYKYLPLSIATVVGYAEPMIQVIFSIFFFRASVSIKEWLLILLGYCGVFLIAYTKYDPQDGIFTTAILVALLASVFISIVKVATKYLTKEEPTHQVIFYSTLLNIISSSLFVFFTSSSWSNPMPPTHILGLLPIISFFGFMTQYSFTRALSLTDMHVLSPIAYLRLIFVLPIGFYFYGEVPTWTTLVGSSVIILANYCLLLPQKNTEDDHQPQPSAGG